MSAALSYPVSALKSSAKSRAQILILEPDLAVLDYLRLTLGIQYSLSLFSEEQALLDRLEKAERARSASAGAAHQPGSSAAFDPYPLHEAASACDRAVVLGGAAGSGDGDPPRGSRHRDEAVYRQRCGAGDRRAPGRRAEKNVPAADALKEIPLNETHSFVRSSKRMRDLEAQAALVARADIPLLILGESGTGKEILALYTHKMSARSQNIFLKVNCAAVPADLLESELFGYEQGAFTGAVKTKPGKFEVCTGGTIFLDEIGEMPAILQAKLLQVLQDGTFSRLGSRSPMKVDVRVIAATNINMKEAMANKTFREDLYYRLNGFTLSIPPLRERKEEIPVLSEYFMRKGAKRYGREPLPFSAEAAECAD